jgi:hypothetical protein
MSDAPARSIVDRMLAPGMPAGVSDAGPRLVAFRRFLLLAIAVEQLDALHHWKTQPGYEVHVVAAILLAACAVSVWFERLARPATLAATALMLAEVTLAFPRAANHHYLETLLLVFLCLLHGHEEDERRSLLAVLGWVVTIGLVWSGLQKLFYGYYFNGSFLSFTMAEQSRFAGFFSLFVPAAELERLRGLTFEAGAGPYLVDSFALQLMSQLTWALEILVPPLLLVPRLRQAAAWLLIAFIAAVELGARELYFGLLMVQMLLLFPRAELNRRLLPLFVLFYLYLLAMSAGLLPRWYFT